MLCIRLTMIFNNTRFKYLISFYLLIINLVMSIPTADLDVKSSTKDTCKTATCQEQASLILENMDKTVDPCDNFYKFVCGNFTKNAIIREDRSLNDSFLSIHDKLQQQLKITIETEIEDSDPQTFKLLQSYYKVCTNEEQIGKTDEAEFLKILNEFGGWPVLVGQCWDESKFDWKQTVYKLRETGFSFDQIIRFEIKPDEKNNSRRLIHLDQASLGISRAYLSRGPKQEVVKAYFKFMIDFAELFGADRVQATEELKETLNFEISLANISVPGSKRRDSEKLYNLMSVSELDKNYSYLSWLEYINGILFPNERIVASEQVIVVEPSFYKGLGELLSKTPKRVLANYLLWHLGMESSVLLDERVRKVRREFTASISGSRTQSPRWRVCLDEVNSNLGPALGALYVRKYYSNETKSSASEMVWNIRKSYKKILTEVDWMDNKTRSIALDKLAHMAEMIAYPDELLDNKKLDDYYGKLIVNPGSYFRTVINMNKFFKTREIEDLKKPFIKLNWTNINYGSAAVVNAYYEVTQNAIILPAGIIQGIFFKKDNPNYMNYAGLGTIAGHETTHGFDDKGRLYDEDGNLFDRWKAATRKEYLKRAQCIINQYSNYKDEELNLNLNGMNSQGENIADIGGVKEAYLAYNAWMNKNGCEPRLPGLESYNNMQMFWISYATMWCTKYRPEYLKNFIITNPHSPAPFRVIGSISNRPEFAKDFDCPSGSFMNPVKKCNVW